MLSAPKHPSLSRNSRWLRSELVFVNAACRILSRNMSRMKEERSRPLFSLDRVMSALSFGKRCKKPPVFSHFYANFRPETSTSICSATRLREKQPWLRFRFLLFGNFFGKFIRTGDCYRAGILMRWGGRKQQEAFSRYFSDESVFVVFESEFAENSRPFNFFLFRPNGVDLFASFLADKKRIV